MELNAVWLIKMTWPQQFQGSLGWGSEGGAGNIYITMGTEKVLICARVRWGSNDCWKNWTTAILKHMNSNKSLFLHIVPAQFEYTLF